MISRYLLLSIVLISLSSCAAEIRPSFEIMNESELALYNTSSSFDERIICREEVDGWFIFSGAISFREEAENQDWRGMSFRRNPKICLSVQQLKTLDRNAKFSGEAPVFSPGFDSYQPADAADYPSTFN
jgi:hypothetical protein